MTALPQCEMSVMSSTSSSSSDDEDEEDLSMLTLAEYADCWLRRRRRKEKKRRAVLNLNVKAEGGPRAGEMPQCRILMPPQNQWFR